MKAKHFFLMCAMGTYSALALAQWQWVDESGRNVFSDRPPPSHIPSAKIIKRPPGSLPPSAPKQVEVLPLDEVQPAEPPAAPASAPTSAPPTPSAEQLKQAEADKAAQAAEKAAEETKRQAEEMERRKQQAQQAKVRQENCERARLAQSTLQPGQRVATINDKGERGFMSDDQRQKELHKAREVIKTNC